MILTNKEQIKEILDKTNINVLDEINIIEYIDELEQIKEKNDKAIDFIKNNIVATETEEILLDILRGNDYEE